MKRNLTCVVCGKSFEKYVSEKELAKNKYGFSCKKCVQQHLSKINKTMFAKPENYIVKKCIHCGKEFKRHKSIEKLALQRSKKNMGTMFCSRHCMYKYKKLHPQEFLKSIKGREELSKKMRGENNPLYQHGNRVGADKYNYQFRSFLKKQVREKFNNICCLCGRKKQIGERNFACHHKDFNKKNNNMDNLELLCSSCHMKVHMAQKKQDLLQKKLSLNKLNK